jgi:hypothetical protein
MCPRVRACRALGQCQKKLPLGVPQIAEDLPVVPVEPEPRRSACTTPLLKACKAGPGGNQIHRSRPIDPRELDVFAEPGSSASVPLAKEFERRDGRAPRERPDGAERPGHVSARSSPLTHQGRPYPRISAERWRQPQSQRAPAAAHSRGRWSAGRPRGRHVQVRNHRPLSPLSLVPRARHLAERGHLTGGR